MKFYKQKSYYNKLPLLKHVFVVFNIKEKTIPVILTSYYTYKVFHNISSYVFNFKCFLYTQCAINVRAINFMYLMLFLMRSFYVSLKKYSQTSKLLIVI